MELDSLFAQALRKTHHFSAKQPQSFCTTIKLFLFWLSMKLFSWPFPFQVSEYMPRKILVMEREQLTHFKCFDAQASYGCDSQFYVVSENSIIWFSMWSCFMYFNRSKSNGLPHVTQCCIKQTLLLCFHSSDDKIECSVYNTDCFIQLKLHSYELEGVLQVKLLFQKKNLL